MPRKYTPEEQVESFWRRVDRTGGPDACWNWKAIKSNYGYGQMKVCGRLTYAHRFAWSLSYGSIPDGLYVCHHCDNRLCCNPAHLWLGTSADNTADRHAKGRSARGETIGTSKLTDAAVREIRRRYNGGPSLMKLSEEFDVSRSVIWAVATRRRWAHVQDDA